MNTWIDVHAHLNMLELDPDAAVLDAETHGVKNLITIGTNPEDWPLVLSYAKKHFPKVACTLGVHPHDAEVWNDAVRDQLVSGLVHPEVIAVGEIGLDYYYDNAPKEAQKKAFREQMSIAAQYNLPVEIHTREAEQDTLEILKEFKGQVKGLLHCFTSSWSLAEQALDLGYNISISGVVTFKNAEELRETVRKIPLDRIHVETDAPFLAPIPKRGQKNRPSFVVHTAAFVAELKGVTTEVLAEATFKNATRLFARWPLLG